MHPYSYNRLRPHTQVQTENDTEPTGTSSDNIDAEGQGMSSQFAQLMAMMEAMRGGQSGDAPENAPDLMKLMSMMQGVRGGQSGDAAENNPPDIMRLMAMMQAMQAMRGGAAGGNGMQNMLPLIAALGGNGFNMNSAPDNASGGPNHANPIFSLLQGMVPPQTAQMLSMLSSFR